MEIKELKKLLQQPYKTDNWKELLTHVFDQVQFLSVPQIVPNDDDRIKELKQYGTVQLSDNKNLALFELTLNDNVNLIRNRVGLNEVVKKYIDQDSFHGILSVFEQGKEDYRFTFTARDTEFDKDEGFIDKDTDTKRFTYILGKNESCRTAAERFDQLSKIEEKNLKAVEEAFNVEKLSKSFFNDYVKEFDKLVAYIKGKPTYYQAVFEKEESAARNYVKKFMGRLVFLKFIQKKGWLGVSMKEKGWKNGDFSFLENQYKNCETKSLFVSQFLNPLFYEALNVGNRKNDEFQQRGYKIPYLSGGLFENENPKDNRVDFDEQELNSLFDFFERYNFTIDENDVNDKEVGIDPEMLGHIFENLLEDNKDKGAFYTPKEIVRYMCQESLKEYLKTYLEKAKQWPEDTQQAEELDKQLSAFVEKKETAKMSRYDVAMATALRDVKICDPAIGSGAFPMGLLNEIFMLIKELHHESPDTVGDIWKMKGKTFEANTVKLNIIQNTIYGVDIEPGAVDIARLRFWLSLIIEEEEPKPLPHLDYKIVVGDSLINKFENTVIEIDWERKSSVGDAEKHIKALQENLKNIVKKQKQFFDSDDNSEKQILAIEIRDLKLDVLTNQISFNKELYFNQNQKTTDIGLGLKAKDHKKNLEIDLKLAEFKNTINKLSELKLDKKQDFNHFDWKLDFPEVMNPEINAESGFDIVIGNPPYLSNKGVEDAVKEHFGFSDDLYNYFFLRGDKILREKGIFCFITSNTFLTLQTKANIRDLILNNQLLSLVNLGHDVFESAMVSTAITIYKNSNFNNKLVCNLIDARGKKKLAQAQNYELNVNEFKNTPNNIFFTPNEFNKQIHDLYSRKIDELLNSYWDMISTSRNISKNTKKLANYRKKLRPGDITLLGLITDGGQGLATANNGRFVGVLKGTKEADRVYETRIKKLKEFNKKFNTTYDISNCNEFEIRELFDSLKIEYGRDCFGQGYLFRIVDENELATVEDLTAEEKSNGINNNKCFVPYDKGDKDGNRWYLKTPYYIDWSVKNVLFFKRNSGKKGKGMPVLRNTKFYFQEGFCWSDIHTVLIKSRLKGKSVHDVKSMSLFPLIDSITAKYLVCIINSRFASEFSHEFLNNTSSFQINDARRLPIIVPTDKQLKDFEILFDKSYEIQIQKHYNKISQELAESQLQITQKELDTKVDELYNLSKLN